MATPRRKQSFYDWARQGEATFPSEDYSFWAGAMSFADTLPSAIALKKSEPEIWNIPPTILYTHSSQKDDELPESVLSIRKNSMGFLKGFDVLIQVFSGTLLFGAIQNAGELIRDSYKSDRGALAWTAGFLGGAMATVGRAGLFVTQILAGAIRLPLAIVAGAIGLIWGAGVALATQKPILRCMWAGMIDFIWPFAPKTANLAVAGLALDLAKENLPLKGNADAALYIDVTTKKRNMNLLIGVLSIAIAIILIALLATGTFGIGLAALPAVQIIAGGIATALNYAFGWAGLQIAAAGISTGTPILSGLVQWAGLGAVFSKKVVIATMMIGALSTFFSNVINTFKDNVAGTDQNSAGSRSTSRAQGVIIPAASGTGSLKYDSRNDQSNPYSSTYSNSSHELYFSNDKGNEKGNSNEQENANKITRGRKG